MPRPIGALMGQAGVPNLPEDVQPLFSLFEKRAAELSPQATQALTREFGRIAKIPPASAEYGVIRTYIEWLLALPWKKVSPVNDKLDLAEARKRLEDEHEGLEAVKRRVIEYLAVYR
jgi:ATP-dependent Lon protease